VEIPVKRGRSVVYPAYRGPVEFLSR